MEKEIYFINGMPRSGSTLLCNILSQNPDFHATSTSGLSDIVYDINEIWQKNPSIKASETPEKKLTIIRDLIYSYHRDIERPVVFNKSRGWAPIIELLEMSLQKNVKILTTTRNLPSILASFEKLYRKELKMVDSPMMRSREMSILSNRVNIWANGVVGSTFNNIQDAFLSSASAFILFAASVVSCAAFDNSEHAVNKKIELKTNNVERIFFMICGVF